MRKKIRYGLLCDKETMKWFRTSSLSSSFKIQLLIVIYNTKMKDMS